VIITCPECGTKYRYDERRFDGSPTKTVKCTSCGFTFSAANPIAAPHPDEATDLGGGGGPSSAAPSEPGARLELGEMPSSAPQQPSFHTPPDLELEYEPEEDPVPEPEAGSEVETPIPALPPDPRYSLAVIAGGQAGTVFQIHKSRVLLGRGSAMDIQLRDSEVSRRHAMLEIRDPDVTLVDLGATNGTWFNGTRVETANLGHQDEFTLGSTTLMLIVTPVQGAR